MQLSIFKVRHKMSRSQSWAKGGKSCLLLVFYTDTYIDSKYYLHHGRNIMGFNDAGTCIPTEVASFCALIQKGWDQRKLNSYGQLSQTVAVFCPSTSGCGRARSDGGDHGMPKGCPGAAAWGTHSGEWEQSSRTRSAWAHNVSPAWRFATVVFYFIINCLFNGKMNSKSTCKIK